MNRQIPVLFLLLGLGMIDSPAADFWHAKKFSKWSDKEVSKLLRDSPWARSIGMRVEQQRRGSSPGSGGSSGGGSSRRGGRGGSGSSTLANDSNAFVPASDVLVRWHTALPIKQAVARARYGNEVASSPDAAKTLNRHETQYIVGVIGVPAPAVQTEDEQLRAGAHLEVKDHPPLQAAKVIVDRQPGAADLYLFFPKEQAGGHVITPEDDEVEVVVKLESQTIKRKFKLAEMMYDGKLEM